MVAYCEEQNIYTYSIGKKYFRIVDTGGMYSNHIVDTAYM